MVREFYFFLVHLVYFINFESELTFLLANPADVTLSLSLVSKPELLFSRNYLAGVFRDDVALLRIVIDKYL